MVSLGLYSEVGSVIGGLLNPSVAPPLGVEDLVVLTSPIQHLPQLEAFLAAVSDPYSPSYAHFLTNSEFTEYYGPALADQLGISNYLASNGLTVEYVSSDHLTVAAEGTLSQLEQAFAVAFQVYTKSGQTFFAPTASPSVPSSLLPWVQDVVGLTNYDFGIQPALAFRGTGSLTSGQQVPGTGVQDYPNQMTYEFQLNQLWNATGNQTAGVHPSFAQGVVVATALWDSRNLTAGQYCPYSTTDIYDFFHGLTGSESMPSQLPAPYDHANYNITGDPGTPPGTGDCTSGISGVSPNTASEELDFEMTIDQEWSGEDAPGAYIEPTYVGGLGVTNGATNSNIDLMLAWMAAGNIPNLSAVSQSFGGGESSPEPDVTYYMELGATGVTVLASSGDNSGSSGEACVNPDIPGGSIATTMTPIVDYPGSSPYLLSVGGSANMAYGTAAAPTAILPGQSVWNWCPSTDGGLIGGSTGGVSSTSLEPSYQAADPIVTRAMQWAINVTETGNFTNGAPPSGCLGCDDGLVASATSARAVPDVAGPAAMNTGYMGGTWVTGFGGTSFSSPAIAGMLGSIMAFDGHRLGFVNPALYALEQEYLNGDFAGLPFPGAPTYFVNNYSNAFFNGGPYYNTSAGWGIPQAYNIALLLGKPFISTNPTGPALVGQAYPVTATVLDDRAISSVNVTYRLDGGSWQTAPLALAGGTRNSGTWTGSISAPAQTGVLEYCISGIDEGMGNSWSPYNQSAWVATGGANLSFGCTVPFHVTVHATYPVIFTEAGLASGTSWSVTLDAGTQSSTTTAILYPAVANGTYPFAIGSVAGYTASPSSGTVTVNGGLQVVAITFTPISNPTYGVTFTESGLAPGTAWSVTLNDVSQSSTSSSIDFAEVDGSYSFTVGAVAGYTASPSSGSLEVNGAPTSVAVTFSHSGGGHHAVTFTESGLSTGASWSVTLNGVTGSSTGNAIKFTESEGTYSYSVGAVPAYTASPSYGTVTVTGRNVNQAITFSLISGCGTTGSSTSTDFNGQSLASGSYLWFNAALQWMGKAPANPVTIYFECQTITFASNSGMGSITVPAASVSYDPGATLASTTFDGGMWVTTVPASFSDKVFLAGVAVAVPASGIAGGVKDITWSGGFNASAPVSVQWQWAAAAYSQFTSSYGQLGVKPAHGTHIDQYANGDAAGTPENYTSYVIAGATGNGGTNYTGDYGPAVRVRVEQ